MNEFVFWPLVVAAPLLGLFAASLGGRGVYPWLWLSSLPAIAVVLHPAEPVVLDFLWPGAQWGAADNLTQGWLAFTAFLWGCAGAFAGNAGRKESYNLQFWVFWLMSLAGNLLLIVAQDGLSFYVGFTMMSMAAYGLVVHLGGPQPRRAGRLYLQLAITGEFLVFAALVLRAHAADGSTAFAQWQTAPLDEITLVLVVVGFGLKIGFWPLHVWLPLAHPAAPAPASAVLSGAMLKAGVLGLWRFLPEADPLLTDWAWLLLVLGLTSAYFGVAMGLIHQQAKAVLAYSSVSQMGYFLIILALAWHDPHALPEVAGLLVLFAAHHACAKGALFMAAGVLSMGRPGSALGRWGWWLLVLLPALALAGLPLTTGAAAKSLLKSVFSHSEFAHWLLLVKLASAGTLLLLIRALLLLWHKQQSAPDVRLSWRLLLPWALLSLAAVILPWLWPAMGAAFTYSLSPANSWALLWPMGLAVLLSAPALLLGWRLPPALTHWRNPALRLSLRLKRVVQRPPVPSLEPRFSQQRWRQRERRWNHFWHSGSVKRSAWLLVCLFVLGLWVLSSS